LHESCVEISVMKQRATLPRTVIHITDPRCFQN